MKVSITQEQIAEVKGKGFLIDKRTGTHFNGRVITVNGKITADKLMVIADAAKKFGSGEVAFTTRLTAEIQAVPYENINSLIAFLESNGLKTGGTGPKVRPIVACKGTSCQYGNIDTYALSEKIHKLFYEGYRSVVLPHKFKIAVGGCPNNCVKPNLNDVGVIGQKVPVFNLEKCRGCKVCFLEKACPLSVPKVLNGKVYIDKELCNNCGRCVNKCPFKAVEEYKTEYKLYVGGTFGKKFNIATPIDLVFTSEEEILSAIEKCILIFKAYGKKGERFAKTIERITIKEVERLLSSNELIDKKQEILG